MTAHWQGEVQLMGYGESDSSGAWIKFQVLAEDLDHFRGLKGTTFDLALENPDQPASPEKKPDRPKGGNLSKEAGKICQVPEFQRYANAKLTAAGSPTTIILHASTAAIFLRAACGVESRAEIDHSQEATRRFKDLMHNYSQWCENNPGE